MEDLGMLRCYTARVAGALVGYGVFTVAHNLHYRGSIQAKQDVLFVLPEYRKSRIGYQLIKFCDERLRADGCQVVYQHVKTAHDFGPLLKRMRYEAVETIYAKRLDKEQ
jgi:GNAT superfamily N-acetyltransferase